MAHVEEHFYEDTFDAFMHEMRKYPTLDSDELKYLIEEYKNGNQEAKEKIVKHNLKLVVSVVKKYRKFISHLNIMDLVQEGVLGLLRAIEKYEPSQAKFSTYAVNWIESCISRSINSKEKEITASDYATNAYYKYRKILAEKNTKQEPLPSDEELCDILNVGIETLKAIKQYNSTISLNTKVEDASDSSEIGDFIVAEEKGEVTYSNIEGNIDQNILFARIKNILSPLNYFIIYYRYLTEERKTLEDIASYFFITGERVRQLEVKSLKKIKKIVNGEPQKFSFSEINSINTKPLSPKIIAMYLYIKSQLSIKERILFFYMYLDKKLYSDFEIRRMLNIDDGELLELKNNLQKLFAQHINSPELQKFYRNLMKTNGTKIFSIDLGIKEDLNYTGIKDKYDNYSYAEIEEYFKDSIEKLSDNEKRLLQRYFGYFKSIDMSKSKIEHEVYKNVLSERYKRKGTSKKSLYETLLKHINKFTDKQILFLECYFFNIKDRKIFREKYKDGVPYWRYNFTILKLEMIHYNIYLLNENSFTKEKYLSIKASLSKKLPKSKIELLDMFYGVGYELPFSIKEISEMLNENYLKVHGKVRTARDTAIKLYIQKTRSLNLNSNLYLPFLNNERYEFTEETRRLLKLYLEEYKSYDEISKITGLSKYRISNIITDGLRKIDFYRFGITTPFYVDIEELNKIFDYYIDKFNTLEMQIIEDVIINKIGYEEVAQKYNIKKEKAINTIRKFYRYYLGYQVRDVNVSMDDIILEINLDLIDSVINEKEKKRLSYHFGIKNRYNPDGNKKTMAKTPYQEIIDKIKGRKVELLHPEFIFIERNKLDILLSDAHLPINEKERKIICSLLGLKNHDQMSLNDIAAMFNENKNVIRRRYYRAIVSIYKYINGEIKGKIDFKADILPNLKYFSKFEATIITDFYNNSLTYEMISEKYNLTYMQVVALFDRLNETLYELINNPDAKKFDYEFYRENVDNPKLPFYGNREKAKYIFELFTGESGHKRESIPSILENLGEKFGETTCKTIINTYMLSFCQLKSGIEKVPNFTIEEVTRFYNMKKDNMTLTQMRHYERYLNFERKKEGDGPADFNLRITTEMLQDKYPEFFSFEAATHQSIKSLIKENYQLLSTPVKDSLMAMFGISEREFMSGKDKNHVIRILGELERQKSINLEDELSRKRIKPIEN